MIEDTNKQEAEKKFGEIKCIADTPIQSLLMNQVNMSKTYRINYLYSKKILR